MTGILLVGIAGLVAQLGFMTTGYDWVVWADIASWVGNPPRHLFELSFITYNSNYSMAQSTIHDNLFMIIQVW